VSTYTVSKLAQDAGVSVSVVRFVRALFEVGIGLGELTRLCHALDSQADDANDCLAHLRALVAARREALALLDRQLARMVSATRCRTEAEFHHG